MRVIVRFDKTAAKDAKFVKSILANYNSYKGFTIIGNFTGIFIPNLSWNDAFEIASKMATLIRNEGSNAVNEAEIRVENDIAETDISTFFNEWKGR